MSYVDGFVLAVPTAKRQAFVDHARVVSEFFKENGASSVVECWGDDVPDGKLTSFPMAVKLAADETVVFSWIVWPSKQTRDAAFKKMETDPRFGPDAAPPPFDGKRMIFGGFTPVLEV